MIQLYMHILYHIVDSAGAQQGGSDAAEEQGVESKRAALPATAKKRETLPIEYRHATENLPYRVLQSWKSR